MKDKKEQILDAMEALCKEGKGGSASVSEIAKKAGIAKGGIYYYFRSKEEVLDALVRRHYGAAIADCRLYLEKQQADALTKLAAFLEFYQSRVNQAPFDAYLHLPQNAAIHQKSLSEILLSLTPLIAGLLQQGVEEGIFCCEHPEAYAQILLSVFTFLLDPGIFHWTAAQRLAKLLERGLCAAPGSFRFLYEVQPCSK